MAITFTRAPTVAKGDPITSTQLATLAAAFNDRLRSGLADPTFRIFYYWFSMFRQVRNPDENGLLPAMAEYFTTGFQVMEPFEGANWPATPPGTEEGANLANQIMSYVFGIANIDLDSEDLRLTEPAAGGIPLKPDSTDADLWQLAKDQRGAFDPDTGAIGSPALDAARSFYRLRQSPTSPHGNAYGGYLPSPDLASTACGQIGEGDEAFTPLNYVYKFTRKIPCTPEEIDAGCKDAYIYAGTCVPTDADPVADHVAYIDYLPNAWVVHRNDGSTDTIPRSLYIEGPYEGEARLRKTFNNAIFRMMSAFAAEYRGTESQRAGPWMAEAFPTQRFLTTQYHLAPSIGVEGEESVGEVYPLFAFDSGTSITAGTLATHTQSSTTEHQYDELCVFTGCLITAAKLNETATIELLNDDKVIATIDVEPDENGDAAQLFLIETAVTPLLKVRLKADVTFSESGTLEVECTEILKQKPQLEDLFLLTRTGGARLSGLVDGSGFSDDQAKRIGENYFAYGCITNVHGASNLLGSEEEVNSNGFYDLARRFSQCVRCLPDDSFVGYAVEGGKSICWFKRYGSPLGRQADLFKGIAPANYPILSGDLVPGRVYVVRGDTITYRTTTYSVGQRFTANAADLTFTGDGSVFEYDGICHTAQQKRFTNEWLMGVQLKGYRNDEASLWKPDAYSKHFPLVNRCHFLSPEIGFNRQLLWHVAFGQKTNLPLAVLTPESPSGMNYAPLEFGYGNLNSVNQIDCADDDDECRDGRRNFYRSCRLYEPDLEIESATIEMDGPTELVKLTFSGRFHHADDAPGEIPRSLASWDKAGLRTEAAKIRTVENALREYLVLKADNTDATNSGKGNNAFNADVDAWGSDRPKGSVYPHFMFTQLIPAPYADANDDQNAATDTDFIHDTLMQAELYLRAMCEGYVDGKTSTDYACLHSTSTLFDFTFENLCFQAFSDSWIHALPLDVRDDNPQGFGPLPNTNAYASIFNEFSAAVNKLNRVRVMLPMELQMATDEATHVFNISGVLESDNSAADCSSNWVHWKGTPENTPTPPQVSEYAPGPISAFTNSFISGCEGSTWKMTTVRRVTRIKWHLTDPDSHLAIPESWRDMLDTNGAVLARLSTTTRVLDRQLTDLDGSEHCCLVSNEPCPGRWHFGGSDPAHEYWVFPDVGSAESSCGIMPSVIEAPAPPASAAAYGNAVDTTCQPGPRTDIEVSPILSAAAMIEIPLV